jgi:hypothetical protein
MPRRNGLGESAAVADKELMVAVAKAEAVLKAVEDKTAMAGAVLKALEVKISKLRSIDFLLDVGLSYKQSISSLTKRVDNLERTSDSASVPAVSEPAAGGASAPAASDLAEEVGRLKVVVNYVSLSQIGLESAVMEETQRIYHECYAGFESTTVALAELNGRLDECRENAPHSTKDFDLNVPHRIADCRNHREVCDQNQLMREEVRRMCVKVRNIESSLDKARTKGYAKIHEMSTVIGELRIDLDVVKKDWRELNSWRVGHADAKFQEMSSFIGALRVELDLVYKEWRKLNSWLDQVDEADQDTSAAGAGVSTSDQA